MSIVKLLLELAHKIWHSNLQPSCLFSLLKFLLDSLCFQSPQTTTDHFKRLPRAVCPDRQHPIPQNAWLRLCWVELPFCMGQSSGRMTMLLSFCVDMVTCSISTLSACISIIYPTPPLFPMNTTCPSSTSAQVNFPLHPLRYTLSPTPVPRSIVVWMGKRYSSSTLLSISYLFNFLIESSHCKHLTSIPFSQCRPQLLPWH